MDYIKLLVENLRSTQNTKMETLSKLAVIFYDNFTKYYLCYFLINL